MTSSSLNHSQHVERIREILIGRDLQHMHGRISRIEGALEQEGAPTTSPGLLEAITQLRHEQENLRKEVNNLNKGSAPSKYASFTEPSDDFASEMAARIDARFREILSHLQNELLQLKGQLDEDLSSLKTAKADRAELTSRFARLASAAMDKQDEDNTKSNEGFLL
jgi:hypothetical protein